MSASGIDIRGRSRKLYLNYRTTEEIRRKAIAILEGCEVDDLDEGSDELKRYKSLSHGPQPKTLDFKHLEDALAQLKVVLAEGSTDERSVCIIVPTKHDASAIYDCLKASGISAKILGPDELDQADSKVVRIATMHRAKGLEFDEVLLVIPKGWDQTDIFANNNRQLQYVAMTRAKRNATIIRY